MWFPHLLPVAPVHILHLMLTLTRTCTWFQTYILHFPHYHIFGQKHEEGRMLPMLTVTELLVF